MLNAPKNFGGLWWGGKCFRILEAYVQSKMFTVCRTRNRCAVSWGQELNLSMTKCNDYSNRSYWTSSVSLSWWWSHKSEITSFIILSSSEWKWIELEGKSLWEHELQKNKLIYKMERNTSTLSTSMTQFTNTNYTGNSSSDLSILVNWIYQVYITYLERGYCPV